MSIKGSVYNKVTLKDIAKSTNFTITTVSKALKDAYDISEETKKYICDKAKEMGYVPNSVASSMRSGKTKTLAVIMDDVSNPYFAIMTRELENLAQKNQYNTILINTYGKVDMEERAIYSALSKNVDGIILFPVQRSNKNIKILKSSEIPFVIIGRHFDDNDMDYIISDDIDGGYQATKHLIEKGHREILHLQGPHYMSCSKERTQGYKKALEEYGIKFNTGLLKEISFSFGKCKNLIDKVLAEGVKFSAIFAFNDMIAWEAIYAIQQAGLSVPGDIAIVGYDNIQSQLFFMGFPLTTINICKGKMAKKAMEILFKKIQNSSIKYHNEVFKTNLVIRQST